MVEVKESVIDSLLDKHRVAEADFSIIYFTNRAAMLNPIDALRYE